MPLLFTNPAGLWALLGIPIVILIHFLQRQSQVLPSSTLFLLDAIDRQSIQGRKIDQLRNSIPLWLQLLGVLILTWLLVEPRWSRDSTVQRIVLVIDSSASMKAFKEDTVTALSSGLPPLTTALNEVSLTLLESHDNGETLYRGNSINDLLETIKEWEPSNSAHSPEASLQVGRSLAGSRGTLIYVTDHEIEPPYGALLLSVGKPIENVGFAGHRIEVRDGETAWEVTVVNHGEEPQTRQWKLAVGAQITTPRSITLAPGETRTLAGKFPEAGSAIRLLLEDDGFPRDDQLFLEHPLPKQILTAHSVEADAESLIADLIRSLENAPLFGSVESSAASPDLVFATYNPLEPSPFPPQAVVFLHQKNVPRDFFRGLITAENHELMENLNWQGLIAKNTPSIPPSNEDSVLLWQGDRPLIILRLFPDRKQLLFNFDVAQSNATRLPAFVILIHRYVDYLRQEKVALSAKNFDLRQPLHLAVERGAEAPDIRFAGNSGEITVPEDRVASLRAPREPGFFSVYQGETLLLNGAANFADTREANFLDATSRSELSGMTKKILESQTVSDPWWPLWVISLLILVLGIWTLLSKPGKAGRAVSVMDS
ncbi:MAG: VWA domain-containing protein [Verrucomicrobiales bacterium]|nr:VWA domain-containing protein [Verrucomicrobiales bacterium]